jgi:serpin B
MPADRRNVLVVLDRRALLGGALGLLALGAVPGLAGCGSAPDRDGAAGTAGTRLAADVSREDVGLTEAADLAAVVAGLRGFGAELHRVSAATAANWTVSPLSMAIAFGMLRAGSRGRSAEQLDAAFGWGPAADPAGSPHRALNALAADIVTTGPVEPGPAQTPSGAPGPDPIVAVANGLFLAKGFPVEPDFLTILARQYGADATALDFATGAAAATINDWVRAQTRDRIDKLFDDLDPSTKLVLANAVYLKTTWASQFDEAATTTGAFRTAGGGSVQADLMSQRLEQVGYDETADWQRVRLPYVGGELSMQVVLPRKVVGEVAELTALIGPAVEPVLDGTGYVDLTLPRWDTASTIALLPALAALGVTDLTDLAGIAPGLAVSDAIHRANVTVDERGTEAAAVTGIATETSAVVATPVAMTVDRPFSWAVLHEPSGTPVFAGHVVDPTT